MSVMSCIRQASCQIYFDILQAFNMMHYQVNSTKNWPHCAALQKHY